MQSEKTHPTVEEKNKAKMECCCFTQDNCELHDLTPEKRMKIMEEAIEKVQKLVFGHRNKAITSEQYMLYFSCAFFFSSIRFYGSYTGLLYEKFVGALQENILAMILPTLEGIENATLLMKIMEMWEKYETLSHWLLRFFEPLRPFCSITKGIDISEVPYKLVCDWVIDPTWSRLRGAVMRLINVERTERVFNRELIRAAIDLFIEIDHKGKKFYYRNFEQVLLADTESRYSKLASEWLLTCSFDEYLKKVVTCISYEERRMAYYLPRNTVANVVEVMRYELMEKRSKKVVELIFRDG